jgi:hypothetical protein
MSVEKNWKKSIGLRNIVTDGKQWNYLLFYDIDKPTDADVAEIIDTMHGLRISYIMYSTKNGLHLIGLTPINAFTYGVAFSRLKRIMPEYYSGQTIRVSRKENEKQELIFYDLDYPVIMNLLHLYAKRFSPLQTENYIDWVNAGMHREWTLVFEKYWSKKE